MSDRLAFALAGLTCIDVVQRSCDNIRLGGAAAVVCSMCQGAVFLHLARGGPPGMKPWPGICPQPARATEQPGQPSVAGVACAHAVLQTLL